MDLDREWLRVRADGVIDRTAVGIRAPSVLIGPVRVVQDTTRTGIPPGASSLSTG